MARGRDAERPGEIPASGWKDIVLRLRDQVSEDHVGLVAAGIAFYGLLALFPAITACMAVAGLLTEQASVVDQLQAYTQPLPEEAAVIILDQARAVAGSSGGGLRLAALLGVGLAFYSASRGVASLIEGMNIAYDEKESRGYLRVALLNVALTVFLILGFLFGLGVATVVPAVLSFVDLGPLTEFAARAGSWAVLLFLATAGLAALYRFGPDRTEARWRWITPGAVVATTLWIAGSIAFGFYVSNFGSYNETFGTLGGVVVLLMWLWLSAYAILLGAELDAEIEAQTAVDSTTGSEKPMGRRGAVKADVLGESSA